MDFDSQLIAYFFLFTVIGGFVGTIFITYFGLNAFSVYKYFYTRYKYPKDSYSFEYFPLTEIMIGLPTAILKEL